jgi:pimeloyl-ACP methyl ester carboxylesterase
MSKRALAGLTSALATAAALVWAWAPDLPRAQLEAAYFTETSEMKTLAGTPVHLQMTGASAGPAIILVHGFGSSLHTWAGWAERLEADYRVVRFDLPGAGLSPPDSTGVYSDERAIEIINALMVDLDLNDAILVGNSLGGRIAWRFALAEPEKTRALVLVSPDGFASAGFEYGKAPKVSFIWSLMRVFLPRIVVKANLEASYGMADRLTDETVSRYYRLLRAPGARKALLERTRQTVLIDPEPLLPQIETPTLLVWGAKDQLIPITNAKDYLRLMPRAELARLEDLGHVPMEEAPDTSIMPVKEFLAGLSAP